MLLRHGLLQERFSALLTAGSAQSSLKQIIPLHEIQQAGYLQDICAWDDITLTLSELTADYSAALARRGCKPAGADSWRLVCPKGPGSNQTAAPDPFPESECQGWTAGMAAESASSGRTEASRFRL